jgi:hypothetical protein
MPETALMVRHTFGRRPYGTEVVCVQPDAWYCDFGFQFMLNMESGNRLPVT